MPEKCGLLPLLSALDLYSLPSPCEKCGLGTLDISVLGGFMPTNNEIFTFLTAGVVSGQFGIYNGLTYGNGHFTPIYGANYVELEWNGNQQNTPEPGTFLLLGSGLLGLSYSVRRRMKM